MATSSTSQVKRAATFKFREGVPSNNVLDQAPTSLRLELRAALATASETRRRVVRRNVLVNAADNTGARRLCLTVRPLPGLPTEVGLYAVVLQDTEGEPIEEASDAQTASAHEHTIVERLEDELRTTRATSRVPPRNSRHRTKS